MVLIAGGRDEDGILLIDDVCKRKKRFVVAKSNQGFGGGGGGRDDNATARLAGNIVLAVGLIYLSATGQLGWVLDALVSIWLLIVLVPIVGLGAFLWWAGQDRVQVTCPSCGNEFQIFKSTLNEGLQSCPFCSEPFLSIEDKVTDNIWLEFLTSVVGNKFVRDPVEFSNQSTAYGSSLEKVLDIEAEIKDADGISNVKVPDCCTVASRAGVTLQHGPKVPLQIGSQSVKQSDSQVAA